MDSLFRYVADPSTCGYLPDKKWSLEYEYISSMTGGEYLQRMIEGWRHFGPMLFRPSCRDCKACQSIRVPIQRFNPTRSQKRNAKLNDGIIELRIGPPQVSQAKLKLYDRFHAFQSEHKGWPEHPAKDAESYSSSFVESAFPPPGGSLETGSVEEWCYYLDDRLIGVGYVDFLPPVVDMQGKPGPEGRLPLARADTGEPLDGGLSAIYFFYHPEERHRGLGVWNILSLIAEAKRRSLPYLYLGYFVKGCPSMAYKVNFEPNQLLGEDGQWRDQPS